MLAFQKGKHDKKKRSKKHSKDRKHSKGTSKSKQMSCCAKKSTVSLSLLEKKEARTSTPSAAAMNAVKPQTPQTFAEPPKPVEVPKPTGVAEQQQPPPQSTQQSSSDAKEKLPPPEVAPTQQQQPVGVMAAAMEETKPSSAAVAHTIAGLEPMQELCISQYVRGGNEYSRWTYVTMFPVGEKPEYIYMPRIRCSLSNSSSKKSSRGKIISNIKPQGEAKEEAISKKLPPYILKQLSTCENALRSARDNLENLKAVIFTTCFASLILAAKGTQLELQKFDKETKALLDEINSLSAAIGRTKQTSGDQEVKPQVEPTKGYKHLQSDLY
uniref:Gag polyprotein n=1 Tax=Ascaris lumbricoides TaxID=6252 RepID=A0A0M3HVB0_ASCLU